MESQSNFEALMISSRHFETIQIAHLNFQRKNLENVNEIMEKFGFSVRKLIFGAVYYLNSETFVKLLECTPNIKSFEFCGFIEDRVLEMPHARIDLPRLREISLTGGNCLNYIGDCAVKKAFIGCIDVNEIQFIVPFLKRIEGGLKILSLHFLVPAIRDIKIFMENLTDLHLEEFQLKGAFHFYPNETIAFLKQHPGLKVLGLSNDLIPESIFELICCYFPDLQKLSIKANFIVDFSTDLINSSMNLKELSLSGKFDFKSVLKRLKFAVRKLEVLRLDDEGHLGNLTGELLEDLSEWAPGLGVMFINGFHSKNLISSLLNNFEELEEFQVAFKTIELTELKLNLNAKNLPRLKKLELSSEKNPINFNLSSDLASKLSNKMSNLKSITIKNFQIKLTISSFKILLSEMEILENLFVNKIISNLDINEMARLIRDYGKNLKHFLIDFDEESYLGHDNISRYLLMVAPNSVS